MDVLTIFQRGARGVCSACGAVLRDTDKNFLALQIVGLLVIAIAILLFFANIPG